MSARAGFERASPAPRRSRRPGGIIHGLLVALTLAVSPACEVTRPADLHPDIVVISLLLNPGQQVAHMLAVHPHRENGDGAPEISASLEGPGWTAAFSGTGLGGVCEDYRWSVPATCLRAWLPEAIRPGRYSLRGTAPQGSFTGEMTVPATPLLVEPADTLRLPLPDTTGYAGIPLDYGVDPATGMLVADLVVTEKSRGTGWWSEVVDVGDTIEVYQRGNPLTIGLRLRGIGWNYTNWLKHTSGDLVLPPWPSFGIEGEGVYGYFDGVSAPTRWVHIIVGEP